MFLHVRVTLIGCPEHGARKVRVPWAETKSRFTVPMERFAIDEPTERATVTEARRILHIAWPDPKPPKECLELLPPPEYQLLLRAQNT